MAPVNPAISDPDSPARRMTIAIAAVVAIMLAAALVYYFMSSKETSVKFNGAAIVVAARAYTRDALARKAPLPKSVSLDELVELHYLQPDQVEAFRGMKATVELSTADRGPKAVLMRVVLPNGGEVHLLSDGSVQEPAR